MASRGLLTLFRTNPSYRRLWLAQFVSFVGDWFTIVALIRLTKDETGARLTTGLLFAAQMAPTILLGSFTGSLADRMPRKKIMIACDLLRALGALCFLLPDAVGLHGV